MRRVTLSTDRDLVILSAVQWRFGGPTVCGFLNRSSTITITAGRQQRRRGSLRLYLVIFYGSRFGGTTICKGDKGLRGATVS